MFAPHQSLPLWGRCRTYVRRMRCSPFSRYKIWTPHPPLSWSPFSRWRRLAKKAKTSRRGGVFAQYNCRDRRTRLSAKANNNHNRNGGRRAPALPRKNQNLTAQRCVRTTQSLPPWGRGTTVVVDEVLEIYTVQTANTSSVLPYGNPPSPTGEGLRRKRILRGMAVCSHNIKGSPFGRAPALAGERG